VNASPNYVSYVDLLGVGDASGKDDATYHDQLRRFRLALCKAVDEKLLDGDQVFAFSDCAFASSKNISRLSAYLSSLQSSLWEHSIFLKGGLTAAKEEYFDFAALPGQNDKLVGSRKQKLHGYWFSKEFVNPALLEKNLKGIAVQISESVCDQKWLDSKTAYSAYFSGDSLRKPTVFRDLLIPRYSLHHLNDILTTYLVISHTSKRLSRYYVSLVITWINSHDYSSVKIHEATGEYLDCPRPLKQLMGSRKLATEIILLPGGDIIYYSLLSKIATETTDARIMARVIDFLGSSKKLRGAAEQIPENICSSALCKRVNESRIRRLLT
jgi:hypothetical protein